MKAKRLISTLLVVSFLFSALPIQGLAAENAQTIVNPFTDVSENDWFYDEVLYAKEHNLFSGTSNSAFSPNDTMTRAMYVTVIGRMEGVDAAQYSKAPSFADVERDGYYAPYVEWAKQMKITSGTGDGKFSPDENVTRQDMAVFTARYFDAAGLTLPNTVVNTVPNDISMVAAYAKDAVSRLWSCGLFQGDENGNFNPLKTATRAKTAALCSRIDRYINGGETVEPDESNKSAESQNYIGYSSKKYTVAFETDGGGTIENRRLRSGAKLNNLPIPYKENRIFEGWCYDKELTSLVSTEDTIKENLTLYAKYMETAPIDENYTPHFASALNQDTDFTIKIVSSREMTADEVKNAITAKNLSSSVQEDFITVTGSGNEFVVSGINGFEEGATFKLTLNDERLAFDGYEASAKDFNFTIAKAPVMNFTLNGDLVYIPASEIESITGSADAPVNLNEKGVSEAKVSGGTFTYTGSADLHVGDTAVIYEGIRPDKRTVENDNAGDIMYVKITGKNGNTYIYTSAETEDVLFTPDVLPISKDADTDGNPDNSSVTVAADTLDFSGDIYQNIGLDSQTTVDAGDFIAFYDGDFGPDIQGKSIAYGKITSVTLSDSGYTIEFENVTKDEMLASMDVYDTNQISGEEMLENVNQEAIEQNVEQQALKSGFAEEAALYMASMALKTNSFTELSDEYDLSQLRIAAKPGDDLTDGIVTLADESKVEVEISTLQATLGTDLVYFEDYGGLRLTLKVGIDIIIHASDGNDIVIGITGLFEQEARIDINIDGGAIWKWWGPFPYIAEYEVSAAVDLFDYTGIGIEATITTQEADEDDLTGVNNKELNDFAAELKKLLDEEDKYIGDGTDTVAEGLADKYKAMLENEDSDWVELFSKDIFRKEFHICLIFAVEVGVEFVVSANVNVSLGMDFYYANAKRYIYTIQVFAGNVTNDVIDIVEEQYQFEFYVMGTLGVRAGIKAEIKVGLLSTKLASVGFAAEVGAYVRLWGFFYYQLRWTASEGKTTEHLGAMLFELGIYLEITFEAQAFNGTFSYNPTLYENEWPLWSAGMRENVQDFAYSKEDAPELTMKKTIQSTVVPDELFEMSYLDLKEGEEDSAIFDDGKHFKIQMTNDAFRYDPATNNLTVDPGNKTVQEGEMIITWIAAPLAFTSAPIQRRINLYWDNYNDGYSISFNSNGGSTVPIIIQRFNGAVTAPEAPHKQGYVFDGWYSDASLTKAYTVPAKMPESDNMVYAKWEPAADTKYTVEHYTQEPNGNYTLVDRDSFEGVTESTVIPDTKMYTGFTTPVSQEVTVKPDGSAKVRYYYKRNSYTASFNPGIAGGDTIESKFKYGAAVTAPTLSKDGYEFTGWDTAVAAWMPAGDVSYTAQWIPKGDTPYRVEHYVMQTDGKYKFKEFEKKSGNTDEVLSAQNLKKQDIEVAGGITYNHASVKGEITESAGVKADGSLVVKLYYDRAAYDITFKPQNGSDDMTHTLKYEESITLPETPIRAGYTFGGWYTDEDCTAVLDSAMPAKAVTAYAKWIPNSDTAYKIEHYVMDTSGIYPSEPTASDTLTGTTDTVFDVSDKIKIGLTVPGGIEFKEGRIGDSTVTQAAVAGDDSLVVKLYYARKAYSLVWEIGGSFADGDYTQSGSIYFGTQITAPTLYKTGYSYEWDAPVAAVMPAEDCTYTAVWTANSNTPYKVEHYIMGTDGAYPAKPQYTDRRTGVTDAVLALSELKKSDLEVAGGIEYSYAQAGGNTETEFAVAGDGSLIVKLYYERKTYTLAWEIGDSLASGDYTQGGTVYYGASVIVPVLTKAGYTFEWDKTVAPAMPAGDCTYTAVWTANEDTPYIVEHYQQNISDDEYTLTDREHFTGTTDETVSALSKGYAHFTLAPDADGYLDSGVINGDGTLVLKLYYSRDTFTVTFDAGEGTLNGDETQELKHGAAVVTNEPARTGYGFGGWYTDASCSDDKRFDGSMPPENIILYAKWVAGQVSYKTEHYVMDVNGEYPAIATASESKTDFADSEIILAELKNASFEVENGIEYKEAKIGEEVQTVANVLADNSLVVKLYYERMTHELSWNLDGGAADNDYTEGLVYYDAPIAVPGNVKKTGYTFAWNEVPETKMPARSLNYIAEWTANRYTVIFSANDGTDRMMTQIFEYDEEKSLEKNTFERRGYDFEGWAVVNDGNAAYGNSEAVSNLTDTQNGTVTLYAVWKPVSYNVAYHTEHSSAQDSSYTIENGIALPDLTETGYTFEGWYENKAFEGEPVTIIPSGSTGNKEFFAKWTENTYTVVFYANDGTDGYAEQHFAFTEEKELAKNTFERAGYTFEGWSAVAGGNVMYHDEASVSKLTAEDNQKIALYAVWKPISYEIMYHTAYGSVQNGSYTVENTVTLPIPAETGYTFGGWYVEESLEGEAVTAILSGSTGLKEFYAKWTENTYTVTFYANGGNGEIAPQTFNYTEEKKLNANSFTRSGYTFAGWAQSASGAKIYDDSQSVSSLTSEANGRIDLYAVWTLDTYDISYILNGGMNNADNPSQYDITTGAVTLAAPQRTGYTFGGWYTDEAFSAEASDPAISEGETGDRAFYAKWTPNSYYVSFNGNGGDGSMASQSFMYDAAVKALTGNTFMQNGYSFKSWNTKADGSGVAYADRAEVRNMTDIPNGTVTLYAQWAPVTYTISYNLYGGTNALKNPAGYTIESDSIVFAEPTHSTEGNVFAGWYTDSGFNNAITEVPTGSTGNIALYAKWINSGKFTIANNGNNTFTITRSGGTDLAQTVYFRTLNGSAIGGTHFTHQENSVTLADGQASATVTIAENSANAMYANNAATAYANASKEYFVDIYKVDGGARLGEETRATRIMANDGSYSISVSDLTEYKQIASQSCNEEKKEDEGGGYGNAGYTGLGANVLANSQYSSRLQSYIRSTSSGMRVQLKDFSAKNANGGNRVLHQFVFFTNSASNISGCKSDSSISALPNGTKCGFVLLYNKTDVQYTANLPVANAGTVLGNFSGTNVNTNQVKWASGQTPGDYVLYGVDEFCGIAVNGYHSGIINNVWRYYGGKLYSRPHDMEAPDYIGMAPMSNSSYMLGSKVTIALVFDEIIASADGATVLTNLSDTPFTLAGGVGTNVLYFEGTITNTATSASVVSINNKANIKDMLGNAAN